MTPKNGHARQQDNTAIKRRELYQDRWTSLGAHAGILQLSEMLEPAALRRFALFENYDDAFLLENSHDISVARWKAGTVLFEAGSFIDLAFYIVAGSIEVGLRASAEPNGAHIRRGQKKPRRGDPARTIPFLSVMDYSLPPEGRITLGEGEILGEIGALNGWPQSATAIALEDCVLVQIRVPALRRMREESPHLKDWIDAIYRERYLKMELRQSPYFRDCDDDFLDALRKRVELVSCRRDAEITTQGEPADAIYLVRSGFVKLRQQVHGSNLAVSYLSKGQILGDAELLVENMDTWQFGASAVGRCELLKIPQSDFYQLLARYPTLEKLLWKQTIARMKEAGYNRKHIDQAAVVDAALERGLLQGRSILVIDLEQCTRCDDCVKGCAATHGGTPRFVREGNRQNNLLITRACYHCHDPACLIGCPTGAIHRAGPKGTVEIEPDLCIGCRTCERNCPYDAITMQRTGETWPRNMVPEHLRETERYLATKCDLCGDSATGPACVHNCPNGCAWRVGNLGELQALLQK